MVLEVTVSIVITSMILVKINYWDHGSNNYWNCGSENHLLGPRKYLLFIIILGLGRLKSMVT
jgi:hypothetical protein